MTSIKAIEIASSLCRQFEGLHLRPYLCPAGVPTIGYGSTFYPNGAKVGLKDAPITEARAEELLDCDLARCYVAALKASPILAHDASRHAAIIDFIYNLGAGRYNASTLRRRINSKDWEGAREQIVKWVFAGGKKLKGLELRRAAEAELL